jgi:hypothetical protein
MKKEFNASNEKSVKDAKQKDKNIRETEHNDMRLLLAKQWGRRLVWRILEQTGQHRTSFTGDMETTSFHEGERNVGLWLVDEVLSSDTDMYLMMIKENNKQGV